MQSEYREWFNPTVEELINDLNKRRDKTKTHLSTLFAQHGSYAEAHRRYIGLLDSLIELAQVELDEELK